MKRSGVSWQQNIVWRKKNGMTREQKMETKTQNIAIIYLKDAIEKRKIVILQQKRDNK